VKRKRGRLSLLAWS